jgi:steroid delta-isomerase-like uncharacterized protein
MMRSVCGALVLGLVVSACGGDEASKPPEMPAAPPPVAVVTPPAPVEVAAPVAAKPTLGELLAANGKARTDAMAAHDAAKVAATYSEDAVVTSPGMPDAHGRGEIQASWQSRFDAFKDSKGWASRVWIKNDTVVVEWGWAGTNTGDFMGMKPTEKQVGQMGVSVMTYGADGLVKKENAYMDGVTMMTQMGLAKGKVRPIPTAPSGPPEMHMAKGTPEEDKNVELMKTMYTAMENKKEADFLGTLSEDVEYNDMTMPEGMKGKTEAKKYFGMITKALPDLKTPATTSMGVEDFAIVEFNMTGTQKGPMGPIAATKKPVNLHGVDIFQIKDGKMVRGWTYANNTELLSQLGLLRAPVSAKTTTTATTTTTTAKKPATPGAKPATPATPATPPKK